MIIFRDTPPVVAATDVLDIDDQPPMPYTNGSFPDAHTRPFSIRNKVSSVRGPRAHNMQRGLRCFGSVNKLTVLNSIPAKELTASYGFVWRSRSHDCDRKLGKWLME